MPFQVFTFKRQKRSTLSKLGWWYMFSKYKEDGRGIRRKIIGNEKNKLKHILYSPVSPPRENGTCNFSLHHPIICPFKLFLVLKIVHHRLFLSWRKVSFYIMGVQWEGPERNINQIVYWGGSYNKYQQSLTASFLLKQKLKQPQLYFFMEILLNPCNSKWYPSKWSVAKVYHSFILSITFSMFDSISFKVQF